ncbi:MAG: type IX secretion system protein PorQ [Bacteroidales bacterium]|nr:type IX secretion system protein PorQ [Bacteroidales bacterium]
MRVTIHRYISLVVALAATIAATAQDGTTAYQFLNVSPSAHVYGLGGHNITLIDDDINLVEQNPALLGPEFDHQVGVNYMKYIGSTNFMGARYGQGINEHSAFAVGIQYYGYGNMTETDPEGTVLGKFSASDINFNVTYSHDIATNIRGGITLKYLYSKYGDFSAGAIAADLGVNVYNPESELSLSLVAKNLGGQVKKFNGTHDSKDRLPWDIQIGYSQRFGTSPFRLHITAYNLRKWSLPYYEPADKNNTNSDLVKKESFGSNFMRHLVLGLEFLPNDNMYVGIGYNHKVRTDMSRYQRGMLSGLSLGAGMKVKAFGFGIALAQPHTGATTFMLNLNTTLGELLK